MGAQCGKDQAWYGYQPGTSVGSISTTFPAPGRAELSFGNCWHDPGTVKVYLDGTEIASAGPNLHKTVAFDFNTGSVLSIYDEGYNSVIQISKFKILDCEGKQSRFILQGNGIEFEFCSLTSFYILDLYINSYFNTENKILTEDKFCTEIADNCQNVVKNFDGSDWKFFDDMNVDFQKEEKCIKITKDNTIAVTGCEERNRMVCRLDCCKCFI